MKISSNPVGNYILNRSISVSQVKKPAVPKPEMEISVDDVEKDFFKELYPQMKNEINNYHFYAKSGKMSGVSVGQNLDRRF